VADALRAGLARSLPGAKITCCPLADGGEGTLEVLHTVLGGEWITATVSDPLGRPVAATYLWWPETQTAVIEMARASGLELLSPSERNCLITSSYGTGELIRHALDRGMRELVLTVGGTATHDGGTGMGAALGYTFYDAHGHLLTPAGHNLGQITRIGLESRHPGLADLRVTVATDVTAPLCGPAGAAYLYAPQKGAPPEALPMLDAGLRHLGAYWRHHQGTDLQQLPGSGAGGGMGGGAVCLLGAHIRSAADWILEVCDLHALLTTADLLITGEGKIDDQSLQGKLLSRLLALALDTHTPAILVCGTLDADDALLLHPAVQYAVSILNRPLSLPEALTQTRPLLIRQGMLLGRWLQATAHQP
jgi:glycerate kinase